MENKEFGLIINTDDKTEGFVSKYIVIDFSDYNINVIVSNALKYKIVEVVELEE